MEQKFDIFISYKRKSLPTANNLYYRLTTRGYSTFFDLEEMRRDNFNVQLLDYIEHANDVFVIIEEGSLDSCKSPNWKEDWFCREITYALEKKKNIIPILLGGYEMPSMDFFPDELKELRLKNAPEFNFSYFEAYLDKLIAKKYLLSTPTLRDNTSSVFKFYSNEDCQVFKEGKLVCSLEGMSETPYYLPVPRKGEFRFKAINNSTKKRLFLDEAIGETEEKNVVIKWGHQLKIRPTFHLSKQTKKIILSVLLLLLIAFGLWFFLPLMSQTHSSSSISAVNLGLPSKTLWAECNIGATTPNQYGQLFAWGAVSPLYDHAVSTKEDANIQRLISICRTSYDIASIEFGENWGLPTAEQFEELKTLCKWEWIVQDGSAGYKVTGPNRQSIFFPAAGCMFEEGYKYGNQFGYYWTGDPHPTNKGVAKELIIGLKEVNVEYGKKYVGRSVRPVINK